MAKIGKFEELQSWQKARQLAGCIHRLTLRDAFAKDFTLRNQILGAAGSIMHNIAEGFDSGSKAEFARFLRIARRSASEVQSELYLAVDRGYIKTEELDEAYHLATECKKLINGMIGYLQKATTSRPIGRVKEASSDYLGFLMDDLDDLESTTQLSTTELGD